MIVTILLLLILFFRNLVTIDTIKVKLGRSLLPSLGFVEDRDSLLLWDIQGVRCAHIHHMMLMIGYHRLLVASPDLAPGHDD